MTREEAIEYWEQFNAEIDDLYDACSDADRDVLVKQREIVEYTISALRQQEQAFECTQYEECEYNGNPVCNLPAKEKCPHGLKRNDGKNKPLTLDELREMGGDPVWVQSPGIPEYGRWAIVEGAGENCLFLHDDFTCHDYGKTWLAYRQKPEDGMV